MFIWGDKITLLEAGKEPLQKVLISGGGRCNVMHDPSKGPTVIAKVMLFLSASKSADVALLCSALHSHHTQRRVILEAAKSC